MMIDNAGQLWPQNFVIGNNENGGQSSDMNDDFSSFLDFSDIPLNLGSPYEAHSNAGTPTENGNMDTDFDMGSGTVATTAEEMTSLVAADDMMGNHFKDLREQMDDSQRFFPSDHNAMNHGGMVPLTPTSMELHGENSHTSFHHMDPHMMSQFSAFRDDPMFTPLLSPAVPPMDNDYMPDYAKSLPFSPLTSPALDAYHHRTHMLNPHMNPSAQLQPARSQPSAQQYQTTPDVMHSPVMSKKGSTARRKSITSRNPARVVRESPSMKPQRKRGPPTLSLPKVATALDQHIRSVPPTPRQGQFSGGSQASTPIQYPSHEVSSNESVSPEPLPEVLMAPPPPRPSKPRPSIAASPRSAPVTPASLMNLAKTSLPTEDIPPINMDTSEFLNRDITIVPTPPSPSSTPSTRPSPDTNATPTMPAKNTPNLKPRKRDSVSSSPALRPKISPSMKPLLPLGMSPDASALLLASKSNYQNIVEGNHSHLGLQYPEHLSTNLTSKRTSHKLAEQGRRNRINNALAEMAALLPQTSDAGKEPAEKSGSAAAREQTSKASTVELAIEYIKKLRGELDETRARLALEEEKVQQLQQRLGE